MSSPTPLPQIAGYAIVLGLGFTFALFMNTITWIQVKFSKFSPNSASEFSAASRSLKTGLVVAGIVSSWTWSLTLLQSATQSYTMGISGGYWYAASGMLQITAFSIIASKVKINANRATTFAEVAYVRFGTMGHLSFLWCGIVCNAVVSSCILIGAGSVVTALTGINQYASLFLIPVGVAAYVAAGGLRATFICDATHTFVLLLILIGFSFYIIAVSDIVGSPGKLYDLLHSAAERWPVEGNYHGSYLTFRSRPGGIFAIQGLITGIGLVACDQGYWSRAIASNPSTTARAYFLGGIAWFSVPFCCGTMLGLTARGLGTLPDFPALSAHELGAGLAAVRTVSYLMGTTGSVLMLLLVFLSVTSALSAELIATSTLLSYDVYRHYFRPQATSQEIVTASRYLTALWAVFSASLASILCAVGITLGWLFYFLGVLTASGAIPIALTFLWKDLSKAGAVVGSIGGMIVALVVWLVTAKVYMGAISLDTLSNEWVSFAGNSAALLSGGILSVGLSLWRPANFDWEKVRQMAIVQEVSIPSSSSDGKDQDEGGPEGKWKVQDTKISENVQVVASEQSPLMADCLDIYQLNKTFKLYIVRSAALAFVVAIAIPAPLAGISYVFSREFFVFVMAVMFIWLFFAFFLVAILPLVESRRTLLKVLRAILHLESH
ncbi:hypothetical protein GALMADRAFT_227273 [Galerina marginata CBS 339.88]|uniref:Urea active transporter n=1 Tax=Galerina marginata (strain CBS 339.88) TaxID=685588 RepID=A0A067T4W0_GALM3|nr:hypothetical protein GALMADRAFT_227273 [Galerina marginata CBS 339.88]